MYRALRTLMSAEERIHGGDRQNSPDIVGVRNSDEAGSVGDVDRISGRITGGGNLQQLAVVQVVGWECLAAKKLGCFDNGSRQAHFCTLVQLALNRSIKPPVG